MHFKFTAVRRISVFLNLLEVDRRNVLIDFTEIYL
jgi:hypothetical protein